MKTIQTYFLRDQTTGGFTSGAFWTPPFRCLLLQAQMSCAMTGGGNDDVGLMALTRQLVATGTTPITGANVIAHLAVVASLSGATGFSVGGENVVVPLGLLFQRGQTLYQYGGAAVGTLRMQTVLFFYEI